MSFQNVIDNLTGDPLRDSFVIKMAEPVLGMVADQIFTPSEQKTKKGKFKVMGFADKITNDAPRADSEPAKQTLVITDSKVSFDCKSEDERAFLTNTMLNDQNTNPDILKQVAVEKLAELIKLKKEKRASYVAQLADNYASTNKDTPSTKFNNDSSKPVKYILEKAGVLRKNGILADSILFGWESFIAFLNNPNVAALLPDFKYKTPTGQDILPVL
jgi:hypothetical protein